MYKSFLIHKPIFEFIDEKLEITCSYSFDKERNFKESFSFNFGENREIYIDDLPRYIDLVALSSSLSYFKASPTKQVVVDFPITPQVSEWISSLYDEGLREFRF